VHQSITALNQKALDVRGIKDIGNLIHREFTFLPRTISLTAVYRY
jgi:hypothetical protein